MFDAITAKMTRVTVLALLPLLPWRSSLPCCTLQGADAIDCIIRAPMLFEFWSGLASGRHLLNI